MAMEERYEPLEYLDSGNFEVAKLFRDKNTNEIVAVKYIERGEKIDEKLQREIIKHRSLKHPNIIGFKEVSLTPTNLAIATEYAAGGKLFDRICSSGRFSEDEARSIFQQLISGVGYCHSMGICDRDLKLENAFLDGSPTPLLKICDFGYSESGSLHTPPTRGKRAKRVDTPDFIAPEIFSQKEYDGKIADVWSCGVTLYMMLIGECPFDDIDDPLNFRKTIEKITSCQYSIPGDVLISEECKEIMSRIFVTNPDERITIPEIKQHTWFKKNLSKELIEAEKTQNVEEEEEEEEEGEQPSQSVEEIMRIMQEARTAGVGENKADTCYATIYY